MHENRLDPIFYVGQQQRAKKKKKSKNKNYTCRLIIIIIICCCHHNHMSHTYNPFSWSKNREQERKVKPYDDDNDETKLIISFNV